MLKFIGLCGYKFEELCLFSRILDVFNIFVLIFVLISGTIRLSTIDDMEELIQHKTQNFQYMITMFAVSLIGGGVTGVIVFAIICGLFSAIVYIYKKSEMKRRYAEFNNTVEDKNHCYVKTTSMDFGTFEKLNIVSPERFYTISTFNKNLYYRLDNYMVRITFPTLNDYHKYIGWCNGLEKEEKRQKQAEQYKANIEAMEMILEQAQKDIDNLHKQSENEIKQATSTMKEVNERLKNS
jgi:hypothetical protein